MTGNNNEQGVLSSPSRAGETQLTLGKEENEFSLVMQRKNRIKTFLFLFLSSGLLP